MKNHKFESDWYRPASCTACSYKREHPVHVLPDDYVGVSPMVAPREEYKNRNK